MPNEPSSQTTEASPTSTAAPSTTPEPWRVPMDDPRPWARGKTAEELLNLSDQAVTALYQVASSPPPMPYQPPPNPAGEIGDDDIIDGKTLKRLVGQYQQPQQDPHVAQQLASLAMNTARQKHRDVTERWGHEFDAEVAKLPAQLRTLDNLDFVASVVRGRHVDDLVTEKARQLAAQQTMTVRTTGAGSDIGGPSGSLSLESDALPARYRDTLKKAGVTEAVAREFCRANGISFQDWLKQAEKSKSLIGEE